MVWFLFFLLTFFTCLFIQFVRRESLFYYGGVLFFEGHFVSAVKVIGCARLSVCYTKITISLLVLIFFTNPIFLRVPLRPPVGLLSPFLLSYRYTR